MLTSTAAATNWMILDFFIVRQFPNAMGQPYACRK
jgi:hypothetical protein